MEGKKDSLAGLKENVIIGKLIPAATGLKRYRRIEIEPAEPLPRADDVALLDSDELAAELGLIDDDFGVGLGAGFEQDLVESRGDRQRGGDTGFAEELAELDVPADEDDVRQARGPGRAPRRRRRPALPAGAARDVGRRAAASAPRRAAARRPAVSPIAGSVRTQQRLRARARRPSASQASLRASSTHASGRCGPA